MNREQMVGAVFNAIGYELPSSPTRHLRAAATAAVDAILPQVTTVEELEALPRGTLLLDCDGEPIKKVNERGCFIDDAGLGQVWTPEELSEDCAPLTVVWRPES